MRSSLVISGTLLQLLWAVTCTGYAAAPPRPGQERSVVEIAKQARPAVVIIHSSGRTGDQRGIGSGFVVRADGVIATNFHVIGQSRPFRVQMSDGSFHEPTEVLAVDRERDLALVKIDARDLVPLPLGDSDSVQPGQPVLAIGNPLGFQLSVTDGVVSEKRELERRPMIQVAMTIEPGSSGSPLMDRAGNVIGIITIKSAASLGFAVPINELKALLEKPSPLPIARWLTIGALDAAQWQVRMGGDWKQRAGRIVSAGHGDGFGGRTLCLSQSKPSDGALELAVDVHLLDESGAAGLAFHSDGADKHYGFYPTAGKLRLTCFEGPDVSRWRILQTVPSEHYRPGQWNTLKVRINGSHLSCFVNGHRVIEADDQGLTAGQVGLVKFREPTAEFRRFRSAAQLPKDRLTEESVAELLGLAGAQNADAAERLAERGTEGIRVLRDRAGELERESARLRALAQQVHCRQVEHELTAELAAGELWKASLLVAKLDNEELEIEPYVTMLDRMAGEINRRLPIEASADMKVDALVNYLFREEGFHGSRTEYYHRSNSYVNEVLDDREGLPLTLSIVFMELGRRLGIPLEGIGLPGHFVVRYQPTGGEAVLLDAFEGGKRLSNAEAAAIAGRALNDADLQPLTHPQIVQRMLRNLLNVAQGEQDATAMLRYLDAVIAVDPATVFDRGRRAILRYETGRHRESLADLDWLIERQPPDIDLAAVRQLRDRIQAEVQP